MANIITRISCGWTKQIQRSWKSSWNFQNQITFPPLRNKGLQNEFPRCWNFALEEIPAVLKLVLKIFVSQRLKDTAIVNVSLCLSVWLHLLCFRTANSSADSYTFHSSFRLCEFNRLCCADLCGYFEEINYSFSLDWNFPLIGVSRTRGSTTRALGLRRHSIHEFYGTLGEEEQ
jgi:hypothetical protein